MTTTSHEEVSHWTTAKQLIVRILFEHVLGSILIAVAATVAFLVFAHTTSFDDKGQMHFNPIRKMRGAHGQYLWPAPIICSIGAAIWWLWVKYN